MLARSISGTACRAGRQEKWTFPALQPHGCIAVGWPQPPNDLAPIYPYPRGVVRTASGGYAHTLEGRSNDLRGVYLYPSRVVQTTPRGVYLYPFVQVFGISGPKPLRILPFARHSGAFALKSARKVGTRRTRASGPRADGVGEPPGRARAPSVPWGVFRARHAETHARVRLAPASGCPRAHGTARDELCSGERDGGCPRVLLGRARRTRGLARSSPRAKQSRVEQHAEAAVSHAGEWNRSGSDRVSLGRPRIE